MMSPMRPASLAAVLAGLALSACASGTHFVPAMPAAFEAMAAPSDLTSADLDDWWQRFEDPILTGLVDQALSQAPDARAAEARLKEARAVASSGLLAFLPQGAATGSSRETHTTQESGTAINIPGFSSTGESSSDSAALNVSWELDLFGRIFAVAKGARGDSAAARFSYEGARASLAANVADLYFQARGLAIQLADARETVRIQRGLLQIANTRAARGLGSGADADRVAGDLAQAEAQAASLEAEFKATRRTLLVLVGRGTDPLSSLPLDASVGKVPEVPVSIPGQLLQRRPDVREAEARIASAVGRQNYAALAFFPTFTLTPGIGLSESSQTGFSSGTRNWSIGANVTQPVLSIPRRITDLKASNARVTQAAVAYEKAVQTAYGEADSALVRLEADKRRVELLTDGEMRAGRAFRASQTRYAAGIDDLQATLGAEASWRATRSQLTGAQVQALRRTVQTYKALGGGWQAPPTRTQKEAG